MSQCFLNYDIRFRSQNNTTRRQEIRWTQGQLCTKTGLSKTFLSELENVKRSVSASNLLDIARALSVSLDYLMTGKASEEKPTEVAFPVSLAAFAAEAGLSLRQTLILLDMHKQILAHRRAKKKDSLEVVDWQ